MEWSDYQRLASRTFNMEQARSERLENAALGLIGESGEIADLIKKHRHHGHALDREKLINECGDTLWYVAQAASVFEIVDVPHLPSDPEKYKDGNLARAAIMLSFYCTDTALMFNTYGDQTLASKAHLATIVLWLEGVLLVLGSSLDEAQRRNIDKLRKRYPDGFSSQASQQRVDTQQVTK